MFQLTNSELPKRYRIALEESSYREVITNLEGAYCGISVFRTTQADKHPTTGDVVSYHQDIIFCPDTCEDDTWRLKRLSSQTNKTLYKKGPAEFFVEKEVPTFVKYETTKENSGVVQSMAQKALAINLKRPISTTAKLPAFRSTLDEIGVALDQQLQHGGG